MQLITNSVSGSSNIREVERGGDRHFAIENVPVLRAQVLSNGYVPEEHVEASAGEWSVPLTLNHPQNAAGNLVSANTDHGEQVTVGKTVNPSLDESGRVTPDFRINADRAVELGAEGEALVAALESGDGLEVSSQYFADDLPAGEYDGAHRERAEGNLVPDSVALLPSSKGVCSLPECGIAPNGGGSAVTANCADCGCDHHLSVTADPTTMTEQPDTPANDPSLVRRGLAYLGAAFDADATGWAAESPSVLTANTSAATVSFSGTKSGSLDKSKLDADEHTLSDHYLFGSGENKEDYSYPVVDAAGNLRRGNVDSAWGLGARDVDADLHESRLKTLGKKFGDSNPIPDDAYQTSNSHTDEPAEPGSGADPTTNQSNMVDIDRETLVKAVANQGNLDQATLEELSDDAIATIYKSIAESDDSGSDDGEDAPDQQQPEAPQPPTGNDDGVVVLSSNAVPDAVADGEQSLDEYIDGRVAADEQQDETEETVDRIIANSAEYDDDDRDALLGTDDSVLDNIAAGVDTGSAGLPGRSGATANAATPGADDDTDADAYGTGVAEH